MFFAPSPPFFSLLNYQSILNPHLPFPRDTYLQTFDFLSRFITYHRLFNPSS